MVNPINQKMRNPPPEGCCTSSLFSGLVSKCFFWMEAPGADPSVQQQQANSNDPALSFEDRATSEDDSGEEESDKEEDKKEQSRASSLSGRNSHSSSIKIP